MTVGSGVLSLIVVNFNGGNDLYRCIGSVYRQPGLATKIILVDNGSTDGSEAAVETAFPEVCVLRTGRNLGYARAVNLGLERARGHWIALLNPDALATVDDLAQLIAVLHARSDVAAVGPALCSTDGTVQPFSHGSDPSPLYLARRSLARWRGRSLHDWGGSVPRYVDWVSGACLVARRSVFDQIGGLDEGFFLYFEDNDWCRRCRQAGWRICFVPSVLVTHLSHPSYQELDRRNHYRHGLKIFYRKHYGILASVGLDLAFLLTR